MCLGAFCIKKVHSGKMTTVLPAVGHHVTKKTGMSSTHILTARLITTEYFLLQVVRKFQFLNSNFFFCSGFLRTKLTAFKKKSCYERNNRPATVKHSFLKQLATACKHHCSCCYCAIDNVDAASTCSSKFKVKNLAG